MEVLENYLDKVSDKYNNKINNLKSCFGTLAKEQQHIKEEIANSITHGIGIVLAIGALCILVTFSSIYGNSWHVISVSVYGFTLILLYTASTLYHSIQAPRTKYILQIVKWKLPDRKCRNLT